MATDVFTKCDPLIVPGILASLAQTLPDVSLHPAGLIAVQKTLPFYVESTYYEFTQADQHPARTVKFIRTPQVLFVCNGDATDFAAFHQICPPVLNKTTVLDYARFYISHIVGPHGMNILVDTVEDLGLQEEPTPSMRKSLQDRIVPLALHASLPGSGFQLRGTLLISQTLYSVYLDIDVGGGVFPHVHKGIADLLPVTDRVLEA